MINYAGLCSPEKINNFKTNKTCLDLKQLQNIAIEYNKQNNDNKININKFKTSLQLKRELRNRLRCNNDFCWFRYNFLRNNKILHDNIITSYRPFKKDVYDLLNTLDLTNVMKQYEKIYDQFVFLGTYPSDFYERTENNTCSIVFSNICFFSLYELIKDKKKQFAIITNTQDHTLQGKHWNCIYGNININDPKFGLYFFDSYGLFPSDTILKFINTFQEEYYFNFKLNIPFKYNKTQFQYSGYECGVYCLIFLIMCLEKKGNIDDIIQHHFKPNNQNIIRSYRNKIFRK